MPIVTLTTDLGHQDYYAAVLKGAMLCQDESLNIIDICHEIPHFDIVKAGFMLKNTYSDFPKDTIHVVTVNNSSQIIPFLIIRHDNYYFIGPDNGLFSFIFDTFPTVIYRLNIETTSNFPVKEILAKAVRQLVKQEPLEEIGTLIDTYTERLSFQPVIGRDQIRGSVIHIDHFENAILNIPKDLFEQVRQGRDFSLYFKRHEPIRRLSKGYHNVRIGDILCLFNSADMLEIAINMGKASSLLGIKLEDTVQIDFHDD